MERSMRKSISLLNSSSPGPKQNYADTRHHSPSSSGASSDRSTSPFVSLHDPDFFDEADLQTSTQGTSLTPSVEMPDPSSSTGGAGYRKKKNPVISSTSNQPASKSQTASSANAFNTPGGSVSSSQAMHSSNSTDTSPSNSASAPSVPLTRGRARAKTPVPEFPERQVSTRRGAKRKLTDSLPVTSHSTADEIQNSKSRDVAEETVSPASKKSRGSSEVPPLATRSSRMKRKAADISSNAMSNPFDDAQSSQNQDADDGPRHAKKTRSRSRAHSDGPNSIASSRPKRARQVKSRTTSNASDDSEEIKDGMFTDPYVSSSATRHEDNPDATATTTAGRPKRNRRPTSREMDFNFGKSVGSSRRDSDNASIGMFSGAGSSRRPSDIDPALMDNMMSASNGSRRQSYADDEINNTRGGRTRRASAISAVAIENSPKRPIIRFVKGKGKGKGKDMTSLMQSSTLNKVIDEDTPSAEFNTGLGGGMLLDHPQLAHFRFPAPKEEDLESKAPHEDDAQLSEFEEIDGQPLTEAAGVSNELPDEPAAKRRKRNIKLFPEDIVSEMGSEDFKDDIQDDNQDEVENVQEDAQDEQSEGPEIIPLVRKRGRPSTRGRGGKRPALTRQTSNLPIKKKGGQGKHKQSDNQQIQGAYDRMRELKVAFKELGKIVRAANDTLAEKSLEKMQEDETYHMKQPEYAKVKAGLDNVLTARIAQLGNEMSIKCDFVGNTKKIEDEYAQRKFECDYEDLRDKAIIKIKAAVLGLLKRHRASNEIFDGDHMSIAEDDTPNYRIMDGIMDDTPVPENFGNANDKGSQHAASTPGGRRGRIPKSGSPKKGKARTDAIAEGYATPTVETPPPKGRALIPTTTILDEPEDTPKGRQNNSIYGNVILDDAQQAASSGASPEPQPNMNVDADEYGTYIPNKKRRGRMAAVNNRLVVKPWFEFGPHEIGFRSMYAKEGGTAQPENFFFDQAGTDYRFTEFKTGDFDAEKIKKFGLHPQYGIPIPQSCNPDDFGPKTDFNKPLPRPNPIVFVSKDFKRYIETSRSSRLIETELEWKRMEAHLDVYGSLDKYGALDPSSSGLATYDKAARDKVITDEAIAKILNAAVKVELEPPKEATPPPPPAPVEATPTPKRTRANSSADRRPQAHPAFGPLSPPRGIPGALEALADVSEYAARQEQRRYSHYAPPPPQHQMSMSPQAPRPMYPPIMTGPPTLPPLQQIQFSHPPATFYGGPQPQQQQQQHQQQMQVQQQQQQQQQQQHQPQPFSRGPRSMGGSGLRDILPRPDAHFYSNAAPLPPFMGGGSPTGPAPYYPSPYGPGPPGPGGPNYGRSGAPGGSYPPRG